MPEEQRVDCVEVRAGRLYIASEVHARLLLNCPSLALLVRDGRLLLVPLFGGAGGLLVKVRNARGDRVVEAQEFFRSQGMVREDESCEFDLKQELSGGGFQMLTRKR